MLKEMLGELRAGNPVVLSKRQAQNGDVIPDDFLIFEDGRYYISAINCQSSGALGLGNCHCQSHHPRMETRVSRTLALAELRALIARNNQERHDRDAEIAWLDQAIAGL